MPKKGIEIVVVEVELYVHADGFQLARDIQGLVSGGGLAEYCARLRDTGVRELKIEQEAQIWQYAAAYYRESLISIVNDALSSFRRSPGLDSLSRIHQADVGASAFSVLHEVLPQTNTPRPDATFVHIRQQLRAHLSYHVLKRLVEDNAVPAELSDRLLAIDLGL